jgi:hypothetical protein
MEGGVMRAPTEQVISISRLICIGCGAETNATCNCGMEYRPKSERAREAVEANPEKSNRAIAKEIGADKVIVDRARKQLEASGDMSPVKERIGLDRKTRKVPEKKRASEPPLPGSEEYERDKTECIRLARNVENAERDLAEFVDNDAAPVSSTAPQPFEKRWKVEACGDGWQVKYRLQGKGRWRVLRWFDTEEEAGACIGDLKDVLSEALVIEKTGLDWREEWSNESRKNQELAKRLDLVTNALRAKEKEVGRDWPATMTAKQMKKRDKILECIQYWQRELEALYSRASGQRSWRVEITTKDGTRHQNGCRFSTKGQAEFYQQNFGPHDFGDDYAKGEVLACEDDPSNVAVHGDQIGFDHGGCVLFNWQPVEAAAQRNDLSIPDYSKRAS